MADEKIPGVVYASVRIVRSLDVKTPQGIVTVPLKDMGHSVLGALLVGTDPDEIQKLTPGARVIALTTLEAEKEIEG